MTDQIPADKVREIAAAMRAAMRRDEHAYSEAKFLADLYDYIRDLEDLLSKRPTLADMTPEERAACQWMQADVADYDTRYVIADPDDRDGEVALVSADGRIDWSFLEYVTPRPDLPRLEWPGDQKAALEETPESEEEFMANIEKALDDHYGPLPAPALPDGWRLADHQKYGRVVVTRPDPDDEGEVAIIRTLTTRPSRAVLTWCDPDDLTYIDQGAADATD